MADNRGPTMTANRLAMSKALGAAFLNHQVEQLERKVTSGTGRGRGGWREDRRYNSPRPGQVNYEPAADRTSNPRRGGAVGGARAGPQKRYIGGTDVGNTQGPDDKTQLSWRDEARGDTHKDADIIVVDASVLVNGISHLKKWCRDGRHEVVIIPLEALNTLDLLKKGTSSLAQRARAASRVLEAQVGTNPRIRVQRDDAFVLWDEIPFSDSMSAAMSSPEWVRRTICCARWEVEHAEQEITENGTEDKAIKKLKVVLAVFSSSSPDSQEGTTATVISASPVPLPAPQPNKFEPRSAGTAISQWASKAGVEVLEVTPSPAYGSAGPSGVREGGRRSGDYGRGSPDDDRGGRGSSGGGRGRRNPQFQGKDGRGPGSGALVERPPAVMAMMEAVSQPSRVVRVLARGEKLD